VFALAALPHPKTLQMQLPQILCSAKTTLEGAFLEAKNPGEKVTKIVF
jgi:hypothetical protein